MPLIIVSPWTVGGRPDNLSRYETSQLPMPSVPTADQHMPRQEPGHRPRVR